MTRGPLDDEQEEAKQLLTRALAAVERGGGPRHPSAASIFVNLATIYAETGPASYARSLYRRAADIDAAVAPSGGGGPALLRARIRVRRHPG
jgi:hypothetical protein